MMKGIIFNTVEECISLMEEIDYIFSFAFNDGTTTYTHYIKHPDREEWAVVINIKDVVNMAAHHPEALATLSKGVDDIVELDDSWVEILEF